MKPTTFIICMILACVIVPLTCAAGTVFNAYQEGYNPDSYRVLTTQTNDRDPYWVDWADIRTCCDLDEAYDAGNTIDYTGAVPIDLSVASASDPIYFIRMLYNGTAIGYIDTTSGVSLTGGLIIYNGTWVGGQAIALDGGGLADFNKQQDITGDLKWHSRNFSPAIFADASADAVSIVGTEFALGNATTATPFVRSDGSGNYMTQTMPALAANWTWVLPAAPTVAGQVLTAGLQSGTVWPTSWTTPVVDTDKLAAVSSDDTTPGYLDGKLLAGTGISFLVGSPAGNETLTIASTITQTTDTDHEMYSFDTVALGTTITNLAFVPIPSALPVVYTGTATFTSVNIGTWTVDAANKDTLTVYLYVDGSATDTWTTAVGAAGYYGGAVSEAIAQCTSTTSHYIQLYAKVTTVVGTLDAIKIMNGAVDVTIK